LQNWCKRFFEKQGQVPNVVFAEGLIKFKGRWFLYYGMADSRIGVAITKGEILFEP